MTHHKRTSPLFFAIIFASSLFAVPAFSLGLRASSETSSHECFFQNPRIRNKVRDCEDARTNSFGLLFNLNLLLGFSLETELGYVGKQKFTSFWAPFNEYKQEIIVEAHPRAIISAHKKFTTPLGIQVIPNAGLGYAWANVKGAQGPNNDPFKASLNSNLVSSYGLSFSFILIPVSLDYRVINYGDVRTGVGVPGTNDEILYGEMKTQSLGISVKF